MRAVIPLQDAEPKAAGQGCGQCLHTEAGSACGGGTAYGHCDAPELQGPPEQVARVMQALAQVIDPDSGRDVVALGLVAGLKLDADSAELTLTVFPHCGGGRVISEGCFDALRRSLPDTDVYVLHRPND